VEIEEYFGIGLVAAGLGFGGYEMDMFSSSSSVNPSNLEMQVYQSPNDDRMMVNINGDQGQLGMDIKVPNNDDYSVDYYKDDKWAGRVESNQDGYRISKCAGNMEDADGQCIQSQETYTQEELRRMPTSSGSNSGQR
jgi:hypothetical protein